MGLAHDAASLGPPTLKTVGFNAVMLTALAVYLIGILALLGIPSAGADRSSGDVSNAAA